MLTTGNFGLKKPEGTDTVNIEDLNSNMDILDVEVEKKVDKVDNKGLSSNDYTNAEKVKLTNVEENANNYVHPSAHSADMITESSTKKLMTVDERTKLAGIEQGATNYQHPSTHPAGMITEDSAHRFVSDTEKSKLAGVQSGANNYQHPTSHPASMITQDSIHRFMSDAEKNTWNSKADQNTWRPISDSLSSTNNAVSASSNAVRLVNNKILNVQLPTGSIISYASSNTPSGYFECNGATVSRSTYSQLFSVIGTTYGGGNGSSTFNLPDLRGYFVRGWDHGRGVDSGRGIGSTQSDSFKEHKHEIENIKTAGVDQTGSFKVYEIEGGYDIETTSVGGSETRPKNIALKYIIKY